MPTATPVDYTKRAIDVNPEPTFAQQQQAAGIQLAAPVSTITPQSLTPAVAATPTIASETPVPSITGGQATIDANIKTLTPEVTPDSSTSLFDKYIKELQGTEQPSAQSLYGSLESQSGISGFKTGANEAAQAESVAQQEFDAINAQIAGLNAEAQGVPIQTQENIAAGGANVKKAGVAPQNTAALRNIALRAIPLQYQGLMAQAKLAGAQRKTALAQSILTQAQNHLDKIFGFQLADANNKYDARIKNIDAAYAFADKQDQNRLADKKATLASNNSQYNAFIQDIRNSTDKATANFQPDIAIKIAQLAGTIDTASKTFMQDFKKVNDQLSVLTGQLVQQGKYTIGEDAAGNKVEYQLGPQGNVISSRVLSSKGDGNDVNVPTGSTPELKNLSQTAGLISGFSSDKARASFMKSVNPLIQQGNSKALAEKIIGQTLANIPDADTRKRTIGGFTIAQSLSRLSGLLNEYENAGGETGFFSGNIQKLYEKVGQVGDPALAGLGVQILNTLDVLARSRTGAVITESEEELYNRMLPSTDKVGELNTVVSDSLRESLMFDVASQLRFNITEDGYNQVKNALPDVFNPTTKDFMTDEEMTKLEEGQQSVIPPIKTEPASFFDKFLKVFGF